MILAKKETTSKKTTTKKKTGKKATSNKKVEVETKKTFKELYEDGMAKLEANETVTDVEVVNGDPAVVAPVTEEVVPEPVVEEAVIENEIVPETEPVVEEAVPEPPVEEEVVEEPVKEEEKVVAKETVKKEQVKKPKKAKNNISKRINKFFGYFWNGQEIDY